MNLDQAIERTKFLADGPSLAGTLAVDALAIVLAEVERLKEERSRQTTLVACVGCGRGVRSRYSICGLCQGCAIDELERLRADLDGIYEGSTRATSGGRWEVVDDLEWRWVECGTREEAINRLRRDLGLSHTPIGGSPA